MRAELWGAPGANLGWELGEMGGWDISPSGFSLALLPFTVGVSTVERRGCGPLAWLPVPVCDVMALLGVDLPEVSPPAG